MIVPARVRLTLLSVCAAGALSAQVDRGPKAEPGRAVMSWQAEQENGAVVIDVRVIRARNDTTIPITLTAVRLRDCANVRTTCDAHPLPPTVIAPGRVVDLLDVQPVTLGSAPKFSFDVDWRPAPECVGAPRPPSDDTAAVRMAQPVAAQFILPPAHRFPSVVRAEITFHVGANGLVDSTDVDGVTDRGFLPSFKKSLASYNFRPGYYRGCPVPGTFRITITFGTPP